MSNILFILAVSQLGFSAVLFFACVIRSIAIGRFGVALACAVLFSGCIAMVYALLVEGYCNA